MYKLLFVLLVVNCDSWAPDDDYRWDLSIFETRRNTKKFNLNETFFMSLENYQLGADPTTESHYPWIARLVHSTTSLIPHACTAVCIEERIFITAARCIFSLKVSYTTIIYQYARLPALAFVVPSNSTKQAFDDIGFVVVKDVFEGTWITVDLFDETNRTDDGFEWFAELSMTYKQRNEHVEHQHKVVGYAVDGRFYRIKKPEKKYDLYELTVFVHIEQCHTILTLNHTIIQGFYVPCYHSCTLEHFKHRDKSCNKYHGVEGAAVFDTSTKKLLGIVTWGVLKPQSYVLPVGFAVPNSENFYNDYACAKRIRDDKGLPAGLSYQSLCD